MVNLKALSLVLSILGIGILLFLMNNSSALEVESYSDLEELEVNQKVSFEGIVQDVRNAGDLRIYKIAGIDAVCECSIILGKEVEIVGVVEEYEGKRQVGILEIKVLN